MSVAVQKVQVEVLLSNMWSANERAAHTMCWTDVAFFKAGFTQNCSKQFFCHIGEANGRELQPLWPK